MRDVTVERARSAAAPGRRARPESPNAWASCSTSASSSASARSARPRSFARAGVVDVGLQVADPVLVGAPGLLVDGRSGVAADVDAAGELEAVDLLLRS